MALLDTLFPFHFEIGPDLRLLKVGPALPLRFPVFQVGAPLDEIVSLSRPALPLDADSLEALQGRLVILQGEGLPVRFSGQFVESPESSGMLFVGGPWVTSLEEMKLAKLKLADFPPHDPRGDLLLQAQARETMLRDLAATNRRIQEAQEKNRVLQEHVGRVQKVEMAGQLAGGLAHNFNNLLSVIQGQVEFAVMRLEAGDTQGALARLAEVSRAGGDAAELVKQLQTLSVDRGATIEEVDVLDAVESTRRLVQPLLGSGVVWDIHAAGSIRPTALCDRAGLQEVLVNLAINAAEAMAGRGRIDITVTPNAERAAVAAGIPWEAGDAVLLTFADTGPGIPEEVGLKAFEPFFSTKGSSHTGLGLATVERLVTLSGGSVRLASGSEAGTRFDIFLKMAEARQTSARRVLVVDDEPPVLDLLNEILQTAGFETSPFSDPIAALHAVEAGSTFDAVVSDVRMPGMSGPELLRRVEQVMGPRPVVFVTGFAEGVFAGQDEPIDGPFVVLRKPFRMSQLTDALAKVSAA